MTKIYSYFLTTLALVGMLAFVSCGGDEDPVDEILDANSCATAFAADATVQGLISDLNAAIAAGDCDGADAAATSLETALAPYLDCEPLESTFANLESSYTTFSESETCTEGGTGGGGTGTDDYASEVGDISISGEVRFRYANFIAGVELTFSDDNGNTIVAITDEDGDFSVTITEEEIRAAGFDGDTEIYLDMIMIGSAELDLSPNESKDSDTPDSAGDYDFLTISLNNYSEGNFFGSVVDTAGDDVVGVTVSFDEDIPSVQTDANGDFSITLDAEEMALARITFDESEKEVCADVDDPSSNQKCRNGSENDWDFGTFTIEL